MLSDNGIRLNKFLALHLKTGRRAADALVSSGKVKINGQIAQLGARVQPGDTITANGQMLSGRQKTELVYVLFNKPAGYVCSRRQQGDTQTIYSLLPPEYQHLKTVGRLDKESSGIMLLTNDGELAHKLTHPSFIKIKRYEITLDQPLQPLHHQMITDHGIDLPDGKSKLGLQRLNEGDDTQWLVTMHEGRNRQIRRTFKALGYEVTRLHRIQFGPYSTSQLGKASILKLEN